VAFQVLCVCTGNICRSPTAERLLRHQLAQRLDAGRRDGLSSPIVVTSAGTGALVGEPIQEHAAALLAGGGVDTSGFMARSVSSALIEEADLILAMTRWHRADCATLVPTSVPRLFTLREFARLAGAAAPELPQSDDVAGRARALVPAAAAKRGLVRAACPGDDDVADPYGGPANGYREPYESIVSACLEIVRALTGPE